MRPMKFLKRPLLVAAVVTASLWPLGQGIAQEKQAREVSAVEFEKLHKMIKPQVGESRWMEITWYPNIWEGRQKAAAEGKPLFLWAGSGGAPAAGC